VEFHMDKSMAKARLVDALMGPGGAGMLKIDAVSLADTLVGYPDLFVSALLGGGIICAEEGGGVGVGMGSAEEEYHGINDDVAYAGAGGEGGGHRRYRYSSMDSGRGTVRNGPSTHFHEYPPWYDDDVARDYPHVTPAQQRAATARTGIVSDEGGRCTEAMRTTSLFVVSSLIPSLAFYCAIVVLDRDRRHGVGTDARHGGSALPALASLCATAIAMFGLGAWKR
jgi:hypothetical protein